MDFLLNADFWKILIGLINLTGIIIVFLFHRYTHAKITTNDLHHLSLDVKEIKDMQINQGKEINTLNQDVSYIKGKLNGKSEDSK